MALSVVVFVGESRQWLPDLVNMAKSLKVNAGKPRANCVATTQLPCLRPLTAGHIPGTDVGPMISPKARDRAFAIVEKSVQQGAKVETPSHHCSYPKASLGWAWRDGARLREGQLDGPHGDHGRQHGHGVLQRGDLRPRACVCGG
jgi:hypothetical protein